LVDTMANKQLRSPFGLFMAKMKRLDAKYRSMSMSTAVGKVNEVYKTMSPQMLQQFQALSVRVKSEAMNDHQINHLLDQIDIYDNNNTTTGAVSGDDNWDNESTGGSSAIINNSGAGSHRSVDTGFDFSHKSSTTGANDDESDDEDFEEDFNVVRKHLESGVDWKHVSIITISFNVMVRDQDDVYYPNEVGITEFTLEDGVRDSYHQLIRTTVPEGYYSSAVDFSERSHKIPVNPGAGHQDFCDDYKTLFEEICQFMDRTALKSPDGRRRLVFCKTDDMRTGAKDWPQVVGCLKWLEKRWQRALGTRESRRRRYMVFDITDLLFLMAGQCCTTPRPRSLCIDDLSSCKYDYEPVLNCHFHKELDVSTCALSVARRIAYLCIGSLFSLRLKPEWEVKVRPEHQPEPRPPSEPPKLMSGFGYGEARQSVPNRYYSSNGGFERPAPTAPPKVPDVPVCPIRTGIGRSRLMRKQ